MSGGDELFQFPTEFPIKVMGRDTESFRTLTLAIVERHAGPVAAENISERSSSQGKFLALTYTIRAESRAGEGATFTVELPCAGPHRGEPS